MLALKNGLRNLYRSPVKHFLLLLVLSLLIVILSLGVCIYTAVSTYLQECDAFYQTIANLEYVGSSYPDSRVYDPLLEETLETGLTDQLSQIPGVISYHENRSALVVAPELRRQDAAMADPDAAILVVRNLFWNEHTESWQGTIAENIYSRKDTSGMYACFTSEALTALARGEGFLPNTRYIMTGRFFDGQSSYLWFAPEEMALAGETLPEYELLPEDGVPARYEQAAKALQNRNNGMRAQLVDDVASFLPFQQQQLTLTEGRLYTAEEAAAGNRVCILPDLLANQLEVGVGDTLPLSVLFPENGVFGDVPPETGPFEDYTVVGIYANTEAYRDWIFLPDRAEFPQTLSVTGYTAGQFRLENAMADSFLEVASAQLPDGFRLTVFDQGYAVTVAPFQELLMLSQLFLLVCGLVILTVLCVFGYLFVLRQRELVQTMHALGARRSHPFCFFAFGALALGLLAACPGILLSRGLEDYVLTALQEFAARYQQADLRFSSSALTVILPLAFEPKTPEPLYYLTAGSLILACLTLTLFFVPLCRMKRQKKRKKTLSGPKKAGRSSHLSGPFKYGILSARRGGLRTAAVFLLAAFAALFFGQLTSTTDEYQRQLENVHQDTVIRGYASDISGLNMDSQLISCDKLMALWESGYVKDMSASTNMAHYRILGVSKTADGTPKTLPDPYIPVSSFAIETFLTQMATEPRWVLSTSVGKSPAFYYSEPPQIQWLEGYSEQSMLGDRYEAGSNSILGVISSSIAENNVCLGDTLRLMTDYRSSPLLCELKVIGIYDAPAAEPIIYTPMSVEEGDQKVLSRTTVNSALFTVTDNTKLDALRQFLADTGHTVPGNRGSSRRYMVLDDKDYLATTGALERQIQYLDLLHGFLYILTDLIGFLAAFLILSARKQEIAIMRGLGTQRLRILMNFLGEQLFLTLLGSGAGLLLCHFTGIPVQKLLNLTGSFLVCWMLGSLFTTLRLLGSKTLAALSERE